MRETARRGKLIHRPRRLRRTEALRALVRETHLSPTGFVAPMFVRPGRGVREPIASLPGVARLSADEAVREADALAALGVRAVLLFGVPDAKDAQATGAYADDGVVQQAVRLLRRRSPDLVIATDVCACGYTDHGHCGLLHGGELDNDATLDLLARIAASHAAAGADIVAPSAMMDGQVAAIREALDAAGFTGVAIMAYAAKHASAFYGPFRDAAASAPQFGDRRGYQMDPANGREALREVALDVAEGADIVMIKPALAYLDVIRAAREAVRLPVAAYWVSGEYAMLKAAAANGWLEERRAVLEVLTAIRRAGADIIITYAAADAARWLAGRDGPAV
ncbi:MAG: porphobilinogen synthase [Armatimonadota bacterium]|nr:porphobilinogen synthase [Armatimonadota bacterium]MDR7422063.1 porphobilinogen synthase [Armatimonadota bacterium]MDR7454127.1 porphobilinogen synthase [Armatimonadota bacterium]MDR7456226.1 porphobilinogen synthase [Armatimonadota bacterium]MDR7496906.1 porphobilinogen synthase [Armatimonadota bacterium]